MTPITHLDNCRTWKSATPGHSQASARPIPHVRIRAGAVILLALSMWGCIGPDEVERPSPTAVVSPAAESITRQEAAPPSESEWLKATNSILPGIKLYYGPSKTFVGVVLDESTAYLDPRTGATYDGVKLRTASGNDEWKPRHVITPGDWHVRRDDPALSSASRPARQF